MATYEDFAVLYDILMDDFDYKQWGNYLQEIFDRNEIGQGPILEMACGTGSITIGLLERGFQVDAFDLSEDMLSQARNKLGNNRNCRLFKMDMTCFKMDRKYSAVVAACDSINYILSEEKLLETFKNVYDHLQDKGLFIFDINSEYKLKNILGNNIFLEDRDYIYYTWDNRYDEETDICEFYLTFFHSQDGLNFSRFDEIHRERAYSRDAVESMLRQAGFGEIECYEAFGFDEAMEVSERINFVAKKK